MNNDFRFSNYNWYPYSTASLALNIPLFNGLKRQQQVRQSKLTLQTLDDSRINSERTLRLNVNNCLNQMGNAVEELSSNKETMAHGRKAVLHKPPNNLKSDGTWLELSASELPSPPVWPITQSVFSYLYLQAELRKITRTIIYQNQNI